MWYKITFDMTKIRYCRYEFTFHPNHYRLRFLGIIADKLHLLDTDIVTNEPYFTCEHWFTFLTCLLKGHDYNWYFRIPKQGERPYEEHCGMIRMSNRSCSRCGYPEFGIESI